MPTSDISGGHSQLSRFDSPMETALSKTITCYNYRSALLIIGYYNFYNFEYQGRIDRRYGFYGYYKLCVCLSCVFNAVSMIVDFVINFVLYMYVYP